MAKRILAILILVSACLAVPARAQDAAAPFDGDLQRLAEILGTLHYLRGICGSNEGNKWRNRLPADLPHLYAGGAGRDPPLHRRRLENLPRPHRALCELALDKAERSAKRLSFS
jgi:predicted secreted protein